MASLQISDEKQLTADQPNTANIENDVPEHTEQSRRLRKRLAVQSGGIAKKSCSGRAFKIRLNSAVTDKQIKDLYLKKTFRPKSSKLETIFEVPKENGTGEPINMSVGKYKRTISFKPTKATMKRRKCMVREMLAWSGKTNHKRVKFGTGGTLDAVDVQERLRNLLGPDDDSPT